MIGVEEIAAGCPGAQVDSVRKALSIMAEGGLIESSTTSSSEYSLTPNGALAAKEGLPEAGIIRALADGPREMQSLPSNLVRFGIPSAKRAGWIEISGKSVSLSQSGKALADAGKLPSIPHSTQEISLLPKPSLDDFVRRGLLSVKEKSSTVFSATSKALDMLAKNEFVAEEEAVGALTRSMLLDGSASAAKFKRYDLSAPSSPSWPSRRHPISALRSRISRIFTRMGFEEMSGPHVEAAFWNFDALFQPQDHPARDLADTFYVSGDAHLPSHSLVEKVRNSHKAGWNYEWSESPAKRRVLRTHTTAVSARELFSIAKNAPAKKGAKPSGTRRFCIGKVFRNEATDYKHLAEFFQVEGTISWEGATFRDLLGTLKEFYSQLGFEKIRFRPSFFPYTEPSLEIEVYHPAKSAWLELGGAGILRPEVCGPLGASYPTLAWGLSLERPLMLSYKIEDIRSFYRNELGWLRNFPMP